MVRAGGRFDICLELFSLRVNARGFGEGRDWLRYDDERFQRMCDPLLQGNNGGVGEKKCDETRDGNVHCWAP